MTILLELKAPNIDEQIRLLKGFDKAYNRFTNESLDEGNDLVGRGWRAVAAVKDGTYKSNISSKVETVAGAFHGITSTDVRSGAGFPYPLALEESTRYHYRSTRFRGRRTAGMATRMFKKLKGSLNVIHAKIGPKLVKFLSVSSK